MRKTFTPSAEQRGNVEAMVGFGIPQTDIARLIKNPETGKPIDEKTLCKYLLGGESPNAGGPSCGDSPFPR
jgi:hypothetical protein